MPVSKNHAYFTPQDYLELERKSDNLWIPHLYQATDTVEITCIGLSCSIEALYENIPRLL